MFTLCEKTKENISKKTGIDFDSIIDMDFDKIDSLIEQKIGRKLAFPEKVEDRFLSRGSVYLSLSKFLHIEETDKLLSEI